MRKIFLLILPSVLLLPALYSLPQIKKDTLSIEQALSRYSVSSPLFSPDGTKAVVVVFQTGIGEHIPSSHIWLVEVASKSIRQFTNSLKSESSPRWSPDGKQLAFLSARDGETQIYLMDLQGGEALPLTESKTAINSFEWNPLGKTIAYLTEDEATAEEKKRIADKYDERAMSGSQKPTRIFIIDVINRKPIPLKKQNREIDELKWMPSGTELLLLTQILPATEIPKPELIKFSLKDSVITVIPSPGHSAWGDIIIAPDGNSFAYHGARTDGRSRTIFLYNPSAITALKISVKKISTCLFLKVNLSTAIV